MTTRQCTRCKQEKSLDDFYKTKNNKWCIACYREVNLQNFHNNEAAYKERLKSWRASNKDKFNSNQRKYRKSNPQILLSWKEKYPEKYKAHNAVSNALRDKRLSRASSCENCGDTSKKLQGHHWHGYDKDHWLDVQWLCSPYHKQLEVS